MSTDRKAKAEGYQYKKQFQKGVHNLTVTNYQRYETEKIKLVTTSRPSTESQTVSYNIKNIYEKSGIKVIVEKINEIITNDNKCDYKNIKIFLETSAVAESTGFKNEITDFVYIKNLIPEVAIKYKEIYKRIFDLNRTLYFHPLFFVDPLEYKIYFSKISKRSPSLIKFSNDKLVLFQKIDRKGKEHFLVDYVESPDFSDIKKVKKYVKKAKEYTIEENQKNFHSLLHESLVSDSLKSCLLSIPIVGIGDGGFSPAVNKHLYSGLGAVFLLLAGPNLPKEQTLIQLAFDITRGMKDLFLPYLYDSAKKMLKEARGHSIKSAIAAIMSRNGSHNIGSHVINRVVESIDSANIQDNKFFFRYLQQRMDFVAQISTDFSRPSSTHLFVKEVMLRLYEQKHLLNNIARSEGLKGFSSKQNDPGTVTGKERMRCIIKNINKYDCPAIKNPSKICTKSRHNWCKAGDLGFLEPTVLICSDSVGTCSSNINEDIPISIPGGTIGFHAFYTIIENFIRNSAKHSYAMHPLKNKKDMEVMIELWNLKHDANEYIVRIWDNYSFVSGFVEKDLLDSPLPHMAEKYSNIAIIIDKRLNFDWKNWKNGLLEFKNDDKYHQIEVQAFKNIPSNSKQYKDTIYFIPSGQRRRLKIGENVRFYEPDFLQALLSDNKNGIPVKQMFQFAEKFYNPLHCQINEKITESIIEESGKLKPMDWGIGEMKITAGYLRDLSYEKIGISGRNNLHDIIRAVPVYDDKDNAHAYRLGYEFKLKKPIDVCIAGFSPQQTLKSILNAEAVYTTESLAIPDYGDKVVMIYKNNSSERWLRALDKIQDVIKHGRKTNVTPMIDMLKTEVDRCNRFVLYVAVDNPDEWKSIAWPRFIKNRLLFIPQKDLKRKMKAPVEMKKWLEQLWITHLCKIIRGIDGTIQMAFNTIEEGPPSDLGMEKFEIRNLLRKAKSHWAEWSIENIIELDKLIDDAFKSEDWKEYIYKFNRSMDDFIFFEGNKIRAGVRFLEEIYGFFLTNYVPDTVPNGFSGEDVEKGGSNKIQDDMNNFFDEIDVVTLKRSLTAPNKITYLRHDTLQKGFLYCEKLSGGAPHFANLNIPPQRELDRIKLTSQLVTNALVRVAVADERVYESLILKNRGFKELFYAGVYPVSKVCNFDLEDGSKGHDEGLIDIEYNNKNQLMITSSSCLDIFIIHQGILDKITPYLKTLKGTYSASLAIESFIKDIKEFIPFVIITSGRGRQPKNLPENIPFIPFSVVESSLLAMPHSKITLINQII